MHAILFNLRTIIKSSIANAINSIMLTALSLSIKPTYIRKQEKQA